MISDLYKCFFYGTSQPFHLVFNYCSSKFNEYPFTDKNQVKLINIITLEFFEVLKKLKFLKFEIQI